MGDYWFSVPRVGGCCDLFYFTFTRSLYMRQHDLYHASKHGFRFVSFMPGCDQFELGTWFHRINSVLKEEGTVYP